LALEVVHLPVIVVGSQTLFIWAYTASSQNARNPLANV
jgi:hypothetical protein